MEQDQPRRPRRSKALPPLQQYRLYFLDGIGSLISKSHEFEAQDDAHAERIAMGWLEGRRAELWRGAHKIASWDRDSKD